jgi:YihY family inner membrane protein
VSYATHVPETYELDGDDARETLAHTGRLALLRDSYVRLRAADGFSHARSLAFTVSLVLVQGLIVLVGIAAAFGTGDVIGAVVEAIDRTIPAPASNVLTNAVEQATRVGSDNRILALTLGFVALVVTATTGMGQFERALNRLYGIEQDRPTSRKYLRALVLAVSAGAVIAAAFVLLAFGRGLLETTVGSVLQWPLAIVLAAAGLGVLFSYTPNRRQPSWPWLAFGAGIAVLLWTLTTLLLALSFRVSSSFGETYGPLAGLVALQLWTFISAFAMLFGGAVMAQLEAVRAGVTEPRKERREEKSARVPAAAKS